MDWVKRAALSVIVLFGFYSHAALFLWRTSACETEDAVNTLSSGKPSINSAHTSEGSKQTETLISNSSTICFNI